MRGSKLAAEALFDRNIKSLAVLVDGLEEAAPPLRVLQWVGPTRPLAHSPTKELDMPALKTIDEKGRLTLGREFAGRTVQLEQDDSGILVKFYRVVAEREAWLWENETAKGMVDRGLQQARERELNDGPDLAAAFAFADSLPEEE
jgi:hypothetical protein